MLTPLQCDSKHPRCTACANAGTPCHQEDRHKQTLTLRGHTDRVEHQLKQAVALLQRHIQGFTLEALDDICAREGIHIVEITNTDDPIQFNQPRFPSMPPKGTFSYPPPQPPQMGGPFNGMQHIPYGAPYPPQHHMQGPPPHGYQHYEQQQPLPEVIPQIKGQDPQSNDLTNTQALAKNFGVNSTIINSLAGVAQDNEDLAVGSGGLSSGRDRLIDEATLPKDATRWISVDLPRSRVEHNGNPNPSVKIWLPKDRMAVSNIVSIYFSHLNYNRPALDQAEFERSLNELYEGRITSRHDQGFICTMYLVLALGTLNDSNRRANKIPEGQPSPMSGSSYQAEGWPNHSEFFDWGLFYKPEIQATISALQALILLHWYLYTEVSASDSSTKNPTQFS